MNNKEITIDEYVFTNINLRGEYVIKLTDGKAYVIYKGKHSDYIVRNNRSIPLSKEVCKCVNGRIREYETYGI